MYYTVLPLLTAFFISWQVNAQELMSLEDRLNTFLFLQESAPLIEKTKHLHEKGAFKKLIETLDAETQKQIHDFVQQVQDDLPSEFLIAYIYWREVEKNNQKASRVLQYAFMYRLLTLRDLIDHPQNTNPEEARSLLKRLTNDLQIESDNLFARANPLMDHLALTIHEKGNLRLVSQALENTPLIKEQIRLPLYRPYIIGPFGFIAGNDIDLTPARNNSSVIEGLIKSAQTDLTLSATILDEYEHLTDLITQRMHQSTLKVDLIVDSQNMPFWEEFRQKKAVTESLHLISHLALSEQSITESLLPEFFNNFTHAKNQKQILIMDSLSARPQLFISGVSPYQLTHSVLIKGPIVSLSKLSLWPRENMDHIRQTQIEFSASSQDPIQLRQNGHLRMASHDGAKRRGEIRPTIIDMISFAQKSIFIQSHFLYDSTVVDSLIKRKIQVPLLDIKILIDHNLQYGLGGFPNSLFLLELQKHGIEVRALKEQSPQQKTLILVDSAAALVIPEDIALKAFESNSSYQAIQFFSHDEIQLLEKQFLNQWSSRQKLYELNISDFQLKNKEIKLERSGSKLFNAIGSLILRSRN